MQNRVERALAGWKKQLGIYGQLYEPSVLESRAFTKVKLSELQRIHRTLRPPQNRDERVSLALLKAANQSQARRLYPNPLVRYVRRSVAEARELAKDARRLGGRIIRSVAAMMQDNPASFFDPPERKKPEQQPEEPSLSNPVEPVAHEGIKPTEREPVESLQPRHHERIEGEISQSKGQHR